MDESAMVSFRSFRTCHHRLDVGGRSGDRLDCGHVYRLFSIDSNLLGDAQSGPPAGVGLCNKLITIFQNSLKTDFSGSIFSLCGLLSSTREATVPCAKSSKELSNWLPLYSKKSHKR